ncbi:Pyruvate dehydrogenase E1 component subunit alpha-1 [Durusdinium trenchii]|uniref:Pyruvate dehydrogenase E1 component subunit alpha n=1 Tax=Durusdinium trenchii TaxID=1381693 RepID=A0ABP0INS8_9DINO
MYTLRRMEITADGEYKSRAIRGFCHLYDGQEAVALGVQHALTKEDDWITTYRCHGAALMRGATVQEIFEELFGFRNGIAHGKGGSMHMYNKEHNFYGGAAIVGAQVPIGAGLGFFHKYKRKGDERTPVSIVMYGDGSANQGQCWEAANMAALWKIPVIFACENNEYGMGTSVNRSSFITEYYKQGNKIPGIFIDGMDVLAVREGIKFCKDHCSSGQGPIYVELKTYRYHGHSMSDPGITYRSRDEVNKVRQSRDPIESVKQRIISAGFATEAELKEAEKKIRGEVQEALRLAKESSVPDASELVTDIYTSGKPHADPKHGLPAQGQRRLRSGCATANGRADSHPSCSSTTERRMDFAEVQQFWEGVSAEQKVATFKQDPVLRFFDEFQILEVAEGKVLKFDVEKIAELQDRVDKLPEQGDDKIVREIFGPGATRNIKVRSHKLVKIIQGKLASICESGELAAVALQPAAPAQQAVKTPDPAADPAQPVRGTARRLQLSRDLPDEAKLNVRTGPSPEAQVVATIDKEAVLESTGQSGDWALVELEGYGEAWVLTCTSDREQLEEAQ